MVAGPEWSWNEQLITVVTNFINKLPFVLSPVSMEGLVRQFENAVKTGAFEKNLKFCTLIFQVVSKFSSLVTPHVFTLQQVLSHTDTFMTKKAMNKLNTLKS